MGCVAEQAFNKWALIVLLSTDNFELFYWLKHYHFSLKKFQNNRLLFSNTFLEFIVNLIWCHGGYGGGGLVTLKTYIDLQRYKFVIDSFYCC